MRALCRCARLGCCTIVATLALFGSGALLNPVRAADTGVSWRLDGESHDDAGFESINGVNTEWQGTTSTDTVENSEGYSSTDSSTHQKRADGSSKDTTQHSSHREDGSTHDSTSEDTHDSTGSEHHGTTTDVDKDGNRTTTTEWAKYDKDGNMTDHGSYSVKDKVGPPGSATPAPDKWTGTITYSFAGSAGGPDVGGWTTSGAYGDAAVYWVELRRDSYSQFGPSWSVSSGTAVGSVSEHLIEEDSSGGLWEMILGGGDSTSMKRDACTLTFAAGGMTYSFSCSDVSIPGVSYSGYEGGQLEEGPRTISWSPPAFEVKAIPMPSGATTLSGSRKVKVIVPTAGSIPAEVMADISWTFSPVGSAQATEAPSGPPDIKKQVTIDQPPLGMSIEQPGQRIVVGFEVQAGQKVTVRVTANKIGPVMVKLVKPDGSLDMVGATADESYDLLARTLGTSGTYSVVLESPSGKTGPLSLEVSSR
jgi:hypothetical protein